MLYYLIHLNNTLSNSRLNIVKYTRNEEITFYTQLLMSYWILFEQLKERILINKKYNLMVLLNNMTDLDVDDSLTKLNTQLNKSMILMDTPPENKICQTKRNKSIKINVNIQPASASNVSPVSRKSILKKTDIRNNEKQSRIDTQNIDSSRETISHDRISMNMSTALRPHNVNEV